MSYVMLRELPLSIQTVVRTNLVNQLLKARVDIHGFPQFADTIAGVKTTEEGRDFFKFRIVFNDQPAEMLLPSAIISVRGAETL